jgi:hypothetical protein
MRQPICANMPVNAERKMTLIGVVGPLQAIDFIELK